MTLVTRCARLSAAACLAACSSFTQSPPVEAPKVASRTQEAVSAPAKEPSPRAVAPEEPKAAPAPKPPQPEPVVAPKAPAATKTAPVAEPAPAKAAPAAPAVAPKPAPTAEPARSKPAPVAQATPPKPAPPIQAAPPKPAPVAQPAAPKPEPAAQPAAPKPAPLDLKKLEERLKDTDAIGVLTKLSLKNQVDDLVDRFRAYHDGRRPPTLTELRPGFELLLMKVLSLLQDKDAGLARDINASRDAIWSVLADKQKFAEFA